jgi:hypothetical protein
VKQGERHTLLVRQLEERPLCRGGRAGRVG